jgi:hypothetical protein
VTEENGGGDEHELEPASRKRTWWFQRPTIRTLKAQAEAEVVEFREDSDRLENEENRLPPAESVHLGGVVLVEAFTPSTVSGLNRAVKNLPVKQKSRDELLAAIARSRHGGSGGLQNFSVLRPGVGLRDSDSYHDPGLPDGVDAVWLQFNYTVPSLTMVVATFTLSEEAGDLSNLMRQDFRSKPQDLRVRVFGKAGRLREKIPWARPARHFPTYTLDWTTDEKRRACADVIRRHQVACERWFYERFPGRFSLADNDHRPVMRILFTTEQVPFTKGTKWLQPVGLERSIDLWRSTETGFTGWFLSLSHWPYREGRHTITLAARRKDAGKEPLGEQDRQANWFLTYKFGVFQAPLAARYALVALLAIYDDELGNLRDRAGIRRRPQRTVREAKALDQYLIGDGLDAATITSDIRTLTEDFARFRRDVPEYREVLENSRSSNAIADATTKNLVARAKRLYDRIKNIKVHQGNDQNEEVEVRDFAIALCEGLNEQAVHFADDTAATTGNIRASAELRQAMANTRLQRTVLVLSIIAILVSIVATVVAIISLRMTTG